MCIDSVAAKTAGVSALWAFGNVSFALANVYLNELLVGAFRTMSNVLSRISFCSGGLLGTLMTLYLADYRLIVLLYSGAIRCSS